MKLLQRKLLILTVLTWAVFFTLPATAQRTSPDGFSSLDPLVVTGSAYAEQLKDAPVRTEIIGRDLIESTASRDLAQIIEYTPSIRVETNCSNCNTQSIQLLGLPQSRTCCAAPLEDQ